MRFLRDGGVTDFCSCKIGILHIPVHKLLALIAMDGMYAGFASLHGCNLVEQCRSNCRGAKSCHEKITIFQPTLGSIFNSLPDCGFYSELSL